MGFESSESQSEDSPVLKYGDEAAAYSAYCRFMKDNGQDIESLLFQHGMLAELWHFYSAHIPVTR
jgi:hypothetical protein